TSDAAERKFRNIFLNQLDNILFMRNFQNPGKPSYWFKNNVVKKAGAKAEQRIASSNLFTI
ncbi:MAG: hypothetical protein CML21_18830, partial [Rheinheimera sp.]|nr:hypothetical protein [Rheinheimera sp.]